MTSEQTVAPPATGAGPTTHDVALAAGAALVLGAPSLMLASGTGVLADGIAVVFLPLAVVGMSAAVAWRRARPEVSAVVIYAGALAHVLLDPPVLPVDVLVLLAVYSVTVHGSVLGRRLACAGAVLGGFVLAFVLGNPYLSGPDALAVVAAASGAVAGAWAMGLLRRTSLRDRARLNEIERLAALAREREFRLAVADERTLIAREMHDVVAHTLSVVIAQADGGRYAAAQDPDAAERSLETIAEMGRGALSDIRRILGVLRSDDEDVALVPQPVDEDLDRLVDQLRDTGMTISVVRMGAPEPLPAGAGLMLHRIAQEALTNVLKHAGPAASVTLLIRWGEGALTMQVDDDGRGAAARSDGVGQGLVGMRERASVLGGVVQAGPRRGGGFRVRVELPIRPSPTHSAPHPVPTGRTST
ncbi:MAG: sensor histidine kinase [Actinomycetaceae bacterium]